MDVNSMRTMLTTQSSNGAIVTNEITSLMIITWTALVSQMR